MFNKIKKSKELEENVKLGSDLLKLIKHLEKELEICKDASEKIVMQKALKNAYKAFNEIFDKVFK